MQCRNEQRNNDNELFGWEEQGARCVFDITKNSIQFECCKDGNKRAFIMLSY